MKYQKILFIDSGIGGISTLAETIKILPCDYVYFADNLNSPYGNLSSSKIFKVLSQQIDKFLKIYEIKIVVLACNTATTSAIFALRKKYPKLIFVGTEPAVVYAKKKGFKKICSITTPTTSNQQKYKLLEAQVGATTFAMQTLATDIENYFSKKQITSYFKILKSIFWLKSQTENFDCIILGCTHYCFIQNLIKKITKKQVLNGNIGVAKRVFNVFNLTKNQKNNSKNASVLMFFSRKQKGLTQIYKKILNQTLANNDNMC